MKRKFSYLFLVIFFLNVNSISAQSCLPTNINGTVINLACTQKCTSLKFQVPHLKSSGDYAVSSVPYMPYPYVTIDGQEDSTLYDDDQYSNIVTLPFQFCFYDSSYQNVCVGSNGIITFDEANAACVNAFKVSLPVPSDGGGGAICTLFDNYYPRACIMGAFSDLDPTAEESPMDRKIEWRLEGSAPCRKFIVSYYHIGSFNSLCSNIQPNDFQIVLYESTGLIDVMIGNKTCTTGTSDGAGILGIQNWKRNKGVAAPGKNAVNWTAKNKGFRFTPSGNISRFVSCELYGLDGELIADADTATTVPGMLDVSFSNVCPPLVSSTRYVVKTTFSACPANDSTLISYDTITINRPDLDTLAVVVTEASCLPGSKGKITITSPVGATYRYSIDNGSTYSSSSVFNIAPGTYIVLAKNLITGCIASDTVFVNSASLLTATAIVTDATCFGLSDGTIDITATLGASPYTYSLDAGTFQSSSLFNKVPAGTYPVQVKDNNGCSFNFSARVRNGITVTAKDSIVPTACAAVSLGKIYIRPTFGISPFNFSIDSGVTYQAADSFINLAAGNYSVRIKDAQGCYNNYSAAVGSLPGVVTDPSSIQNASCALVTNGSIKVNVTAGIAPYTYTLNTTTQTSDFFPGLSSGIYHILVRDNIGCSITVTDNVGNTPKIKVDSLNIIAPSCNGLLDGSIKVNVSLGVEPYQFAMDTDLYQQGNIFSSVGAGSHLIHIKDAYGCLIDTAISIIEPGLLTVSIISTEKSTCSGTADGKIIAEATGGSLPYQYTIDTAGIAGYQSSNTFPVLAGNYTVTAKDIKGCIAKSATKVDSVFNLFLELGSDTTICSGQSITLNPASNTEASIFVYTPSASLNNASIKNPVAAPSDTITYSLRAKWGICELTDNITVNVLHKPIAYAGVDTAICNNTKALLHGTATNLSGAVNYRWSPAAALIKADTAVTPASPLETQTYTLTVTDNYGCNFSATDAVLVTVQPPVQAFAGRDTNAVTGMPHQLQATGAGPGGKYEWIWKQPGVSLSNPYIPNPTAVFQNHVYELVVKATDIATCVGYDTIKIIVYDGPEYYVPNAFTPNSDQLNQLFRAIPVGIVTTEWFRIFNRYGQLIFETNRWMGGWDGTYQGRLQPPGTYVWIIKGKDRNGRIVEQKGTVLLLR